MNRAGVAQLVETPGARRLAWPIAVVAVSVALVALAFSMVTSPDQSIPFAGISSVGVVAFAAIGALVASRTGNAIGWIFLLIVSMLALYGLASAYGSYAVPRGLALGELALAADWPFIAMLALFGWIFLLFPTGTLPSPRWRWVARIYAVALVLLAVGWAVRPARLTIEDVVVGSNPLGIQVLGRPLGPALALLAFTLVACAFLSVVALVVRFRNADAEQRQQIRWLAYVGILAAVTLPLVMVIGTASDGSPGNRGLAAVNNVLAVFFLVTIVIGIPVAAGVSILKYRLWDLDVVVKKTLVASLLTLPIAAIGLFLIYLPGQLAFWGGGDWRVLIGVVAGAFILPTVRFARRLSRRMVFGRQAAPYEVLTAFSERVGEAYATEDVLPRMAQVLAEGTGATSTSVWLCVGDRFRAEATWPVERSVPRTLAAPAGELPDFDGEHAVAVRDGGDLLGALSLTMSASDPINPRKERLARDLAAQAGLVLRNVKLIEELRGSRQRLVAAQDERARKLERDIHDGAQQQLVALAVKLRLADGLVGTDDARAHELLIDLRSDATQALEDLRDLAHGIYPPLLADKGLVSALESQARKSPIPVDVAYDGVGRYPPDAEAAVYFCVLEALQNVGKYAQASQVEVRLDATDSMLRFAVQDDGVGFDPQRRPGGGLTNMRDRLEALGGSLSIESAQGRGATVSGVVPVPPALV